MRLRSTHGNVARKSEYVVVVHESAQVAAEHHHVAGNHVVLAAVDAFLTATLSPQWGID